MIIEKCGLVKFKDVIPGKAFEYNNSIYIKAECKAVLLKDIEGMLALNAVGLNRGIYTLFEDDEEVNVYENAKVVLE